MNSIEQYCLDHSNKESYLLEKLTQYTYDNEKAPQMISGPLVGNFLSLLIKAINPKKILEVGMFTGYSALNMAEHISKNAEIHACELMEEHVKTARSFFSQSEYGYKIKIHKGLAIDTLETFKINSFDLCFIDADKINYLHYYKRCMQLIRKGGIIVLDNMLWGGSVLAPKDDDSMKLREVGDYIQNDTRVYNVLFPIRDGLMVCIKK